MRKCTRILNLRDLALVTLASAALLLTAAPPAAHADTGAPVQVTIAGPPRPAQRNVPFSDTLVLTSSIDGVLMDLQVGGQSWGNVSITGNTEFPVTAGVPVQVPFSATPLEGPYPLIVSFRLGAVEGHVTLDLSQEAYDHTQGPGPVVKIPDAQAPPPPAGFRGKPMAIPDLPKEMLDATVTSPGGAQKSGGPGSPPVLEPQGRNIRVHGRFGYMRSDNMFIGGDGVAVRCYDQDFWGDDQQFVVATDPWGYFDVTFFWNSNDNPDLFLVFELNNTRVHVKGTDLLSSTYSWRTGVNSNYGGTDLNIGTVGPASERDRKAVHIHTDFVRTWRWLYNRGYDAPTVAGRFPDGGWSFYVDWIAYGKAIFILDGHGWNEGVHSHEYGHHFMNCFAQNVGPDYCNGVCDDFGHGCGHCGWCNETDHDAFNEGFPDWLADVVVRSIPGDYGVTPLDSPSWESLSMANGTHGCANGYSDPYTTEGFAATVLRDIEDSAQDAHNVYPGGNDELALGEGPILQCVDLDTPTTPIGFLNAFKNRFPNVKEQLWATAKNSGYELDQFEPGAVTNLGSSTHMIGGLDSTNPKVTWTWTRATDDCSGIAGYSYFLTQYAPAFGPDGTIDIADVTNFTTGVLAPGNWWISIRAIDRDGRVSTNWTSAGPVGIRAVTPANLAQIVPFGWNWDAPLVPRPAADGVPGPLIGDTYCYANNVVWNTGEVATGAITFTNISLDGVFRQQYGILSLNPNQTNSRLDQPVMATGGRHTMSATVDALEAVAEANELDNTYGHQWAWVPTSLAAGTLVDRASPPSPYGGYNTIQGDPFYQNCDAMRFATNPGSNGQWWNVAWVHSADNAVDYDTYLYQPTTYYWTGFQSSLAGSAYTQGNLDFVLVNNNLEPAQNWDVGVIDYTDVASDNYHLGVAGSTAIAPNQTFNVNLAQDEMLKLWEVWVFGGDVGPLSMVADLSNPAQGPIHLAWFDRTTTFAGRSNAAAFATSDPQTGRARLDLNVSTAGYYCLVLFRDPTAGTNKTSNPPISVTVNVAPTPADYQPFLAFGWAAPLVPRDVADGTQFNVPAPTTLPGGGPTYLNLASINSGTFAGPNIAAAVRLDGQQAASLSMPIDLGLGYATVNSSPQLTVAGGRHVLSMALDPANATSEIYETNNLYGEAFVWTPLATVAGTPVARPAPPVLDGGWGEITVIEPVYRNCDGLRTPVFAPVGSSGWFAAVAAVPGANSDADLTLHEVSGGAKSGFAVPLTSSSWSGPTSDYVLANFHMTAPRALDAGACERFRPRGQRHRPPVPCHAHPHGGSGCAGLRGEGHGRRVHARRQDAVPAGAPVVRRRPGADQLQVRHGARVQLPPHHGEDAARRQGRDPAAHRQGPDGPSPKHAPSGVDERALRIAPNEALEFQSCHRHPPGFGNCNRFMPDE